MNINSIQVIWNSQDNQLVYAINEKNLRANIRRSSGRFRNLVLLSHLAITATWLLIGVLYLAEPIMLGGTQHRILSSAIVLALAVGQIVALVRRRHGEAGFTEQSIRGDLELAIWRIDYDIGWARSLRWYSVLFVLAVGIDAAFSAGSRSYLLWAAAALVLVSVPAVDWEIRSLYLPRKRRLEMIRHQIDETPR